MHQRYLRACVGVLALGAGVAQADVIVEDFEDEANEAGWTFGAPVESTPATGGNPGGYLRASGLDTYAPQPRTGLGVDSAWTGDYRANNVTSVGIDLNTFDVDFSAGGRPLTVMLFNDGGTPGDFNDDFAAYFMGPENIPLPGEGWKSFDFDIPSQETSLPAGWAFLEYGPDAEPDWNTVIQDVDQLVFFYGDPTMFFIFQMWVLGMDNPRVSFGDAGSVAEITQFNVHYGTLLEGTASDFVASDDSYVVGRSKPGFTAFEPNVMELRVRAETDVVDPTTLAIATESRVNNPNGTSKVRVKNYATNQFEQVATWPVGMTDGFHEVTGVSAENRVDDEGAIRVSFRHVVPAVLSAVGFDSFFDVVEVTVE